MYNVQIKLQKELLAHHETFDDPKRVIVFTCEGTIKETDCWKKIF